MNMCQVPHLKMLFSASKQTHCTHVTCDWMSDRTFTQCVFEYPLKWYAYSTVLVITWLVPHETAAVLAHVLCTPYNHAPVYSVTLFKATNTLGTCAN